MKKILILILILLVLDPNIFSSYVRSENNFTPNPLHSPSGGIVDFEKNWMLSSQRWVIIYTPHPDDETYGVAGYINHKVNRGFKVMVVLLTKGEKSFAREKICKKYNFYFDEDIFGELRVREFRDVMNILGAYYPEPYDFGDKDLTVDEVKTVIKYYDSNFNVVEHLTTEAVGHKDHASAARALRETNVSGTKMLFKVYDNPEEKDVNRQKYIEFSLSIDDVIKKQSALYYYKYWNPSKRRYSIGYFSSLELWNFYFYDNFKEYFIIIIEKRMLIRDIEFFRS